tara:strand:- start:1400 stop:2398 length:999 start_codon:yes stop_codon:yes gene_type:complete
MIKIIKIIFFTTLFFINSNLISEEYSTIVKNNDQETSELLQIALNQAILSVLGSQKDFNLNRQNFNKLNPISYIKEYKFIVQNDEEAIEVIFDLKALQEKLLDFNLGISFLRDIKIAAWMLCKSDFSSIQAAKSIEQKCKFIKKEFNKIASQRGVTIIYPILDSKDISLFSLEKDSNIENLTIFNDRYPSDGWVFCEISNTDEGCFLPNDVEKIFSKLDTELKYEPLKGLNYLIDKLFSNQRLKTVSESNFPYYLEIKGLKEFSDQKDIEKKLENILFISNISLLSLKNNSAIYSFNLLSEEKNLIDHFIEFKNLNFINREKDKLIISFNEK